MTDIIGILITVAKWLVALLPFILLCFFSKKVNLPQVDRSKQVLMPVVALLYAAVGMFLMDKINQWLLSLINIIPKWISLLADKLADISWMPEKVIEVIDLISDKLAELIAMLNLNFWIFFISNTVLIVLFLIVKKIAISIMSRAVKTDGELHTKVSGMFYEYFTEKNVWCIKDNCMPVRDLLNVFYVTSIMLSVVLMLASCGFYRNGYLESVFYPVFGILIVGELTFYLSGITKQEYTMDILGEDEEAYKTVNYTLLRKFLRSLFGDKLLTENTSVNNELAYDITTDQIIRELETNEDPKITNYALFLDMLNKTGFKLDHNYLNSSLDMLNGKSVLFNNPFYNDLIPYAFYPMNRALLNHQKVLVVLGRHSVEDDIKEWLEKGIESITNIPYMWNIGVLSTDFQDLDIGIVTRSDVLNLELHNANAEFLEEVGFVVIIEPSKLISTAQIGLNLLVKKCRTSEEKKIVYCMCDKNCDGLVDAMSHTLMTELVEVSATKKHLGTSSHMCWEADEDYLHHRLVPNISRYLGLGTELSFAGLKNQVSKTKWYGGEAFPVTDIRWIDKQYYYDLTKYAGLPTNQDVIDEHFITSSNFWSAEVERNNYITVEDEAFNMFEILRDFSTRTTEQGFINIISSEYLLKDYMAENASIFEADAKAIPLICSDFTRSNRNTVLRLILMMSIYPVSSEALEKEFSLLGLKVFNLKKQIWYELYNCYSEIAKTAELPDDYPLAVESAYAKTLELGGEQWGAEIIRVGESFNMRNGKLETVYSITNSTYLELCVRELRSAGYVTEDEKGQKYYLGAELNGHIYQKYLPGQFFTFGGKYYQMQYLTADGQVLVRRAADHINGRPSYRQVRKYSIHGTRPSDRIGANQNINGMQVIKEFADISVSTTGYYQMSRYNDFKNAKLVSFEGEKNGIPDRVYRNKEILRIELPEMDGKLSNNIRYTVTLLLNEIFKTIFADSQAYICALTGTEFLNDSTEINPLTYSLRGENCELSTNAIYIIEDSQLDLGLTVAIERNIHRILGMVHDYLDWHIATLEASLMPPAVPKPPITFEETKYDPNGETEEKKKGVFARLGEKIKNMFKRKKKKGADEAAEEPSGEIPADVTPADDVPQEEIADTETAPADAEETAPVEPADNAEAITEAEPVQEADTKKAKKSKKKEKGEKKGLFGWLFGGKKNKKKEAAAAEAEEPAPEDIPEEQPDEDIPSNDEAPVTEEITEQTVSDEIEAEGVSTEEAETVEMPARNEVNYSNEAELTSPIFAQRKPYHERYYLRYGTDGDISSIDITATLEYLGEMGFAHNSLKQARDGRKIAEQVEATFKPGKPDVRYCDFCGAEIFGVEYETLADGRDRCLSCSRTAIKTGEEFRKIFEDVKRNLESFFGIRINAGIRVEMVNSKKLHKRLGKAFIPTPEADGRVLGVAISDKNGYTLLVENGSPRMASMLTMAHELTHIWQYINWNDKKIKKKYGKKMRLEVYEGMAKWVEIQYAYLINEPIIAKREEIITSYRDDEYGHGFLRYRAQYPFSLGTVVTKATPFMDIETPLAEEFCGPVVSYVPAALPTEPEPEFTDIPNGEIEPTGLIEPIKGTSERDPEAFNRYAYSLLDDTEKAVYDKILAAINAYDAEVNISEAQIDNQAAKKITDYIQRDHPELIWFQHGATFYYDQATQIVDKLELRYCLPKNETDQRKVKIDAEVEELLASVNNGMSDYEVTLRIYESLIKLVDYDTIGLERQKRATISSDTPDDLRSIYGVFVEKKAVCAGYAKAMQYLLNLCGIECTYVTSDTHAWNLIKLEGDYYHMDVTWGDGSNTSKEKNTDGINYDCFCITDAELARLDSHTPESILPLPECSATKCNYHRRHGLYFESCDYDRMRNIVCDSINDGKYDISFKFATERLFAEAKTALIEGGRFREMIQYVGLKAKNRVSSTYAYSDKKDRLTLSFYLTRV